MDFLDVPGASGAAYRFRRADPRELPATAGNLLLVAGEGAARRYLLCGMARSLERAGPAIHERLAGVGDAALFIRLNVARAVREAELADIVAAVRPEVALPEID